MLNAESPVKLLGLRARTLKRLNDAQILQISALTVLNEIDLLGQGFDEKAIADVRDCLSLNSLALRVQDPTARLDRNVTHPAPNETTSVARPLATIQTSANPEPVAHETAIKSSTEMAAFDQSSQFFESTFETTDYEALSESVFGSHPRRRVRKSDTITDGKRATNIAKKAVKRQPSGPDLGNADDVARIARILARPSMDVGDAAWLYGVSKDVVYRQVHAGKIPHRKFGDRVKILTAIAFAELFPNGVPRLHQQ